MRRWLFNIVALLSRVLFVATVVMWVRSYWVGDEVRSFSQHSGAISAYTIKGELVAGYRTTYPNDNANFQTSHEAVTVSGGGGSVLVGDDWFRTHWINFTSPSTYPENPVKGFDYARTEIGGGLFNEPRYSAFVLRVPLWFMAMIASIVPLIRAGGLWKQRRHNRRTNLFATTESETSRN